eukprot:5746445-Pyramimonas_sp.AAC.1
MHRQSFRGTRRAPPRRKRPPDEATRCTSSIGPALSSAAGTSPPPPSWCRTGTRRPRAPPRECEACHYPGALSRRPMPSSLP